MAKLEDIDYSRRERVPQTLGPGAALQGFRNRQTIVNAAFAVGEQFAQMKTETDLIEAEEGHREAVMRFEQFVAENPTATRAQLEEMAESLGNTSLFANIDTEGFDARGEENLPAFVWQAAGMEGVMKASIDANARKIGSHRARQEWEARARAQSDQVLTDTIQRTQAQSVQHEFDRVSRLVKSAIDSRQIERGEALLQSSIWRLDPTSKQLLSQELKIASKHRDVEQMMFSARESEDYDAILDTVTNPEWSAELPSDDVLRIANSVISQRNRMQTQERQEIERMQDLYAMDSLVQLTTGSMNLADLNARAPLLGVQHHARLVSAARTIASEGVVADPVIESSLQTEILALRSGINFDQSDDRTFRDRQMAIKVDIMEAIATGTLPGDVATRLMKDAEAAVEFPYRTEAFKALSRELSLRILGAPADSPYAMQADAESRADMANAVDHLRGWISENGGASADLTDWERQHMPAFLNKAARKAILDIPDAVKSVQLDQNSHVDNAATQAFYQAKIQSMMRSIRSGDGEYDEADLQSQINQLDLYNRWWDEKGQHHASGN